jgi:hypothetical protein
MFIEGARRRARSWKGAALQAATFIAVVAGWIPCPVDKAEASSPPGFSWAQSTSDDVCRFFTAEAMGKAFGRPSGARRQGVEKVTIAIGEAYFDNTLPVLIGRVGNLEVQIETTIQPVPREAMIAVGTRIMETLAVSDRPSRSREARREKCRD